MKKNLIVVIALVLALAFVSYGQMPRRNAPSGSTSDYLTQPSVSAMWGGLLNSSRLSMSHSMGMGFSSFGGSGYTQGYYMNQLSYKFSEPLQMNLRLGVTNNPFAASGNMAETPTTAMGVF